MGRTTRTRPVAPQQQIRPHRGRLVVLALAVVLSACAGRQAWDVWSGLPGVRLARLTRADYERVRQAAEANLTREARQALIAANVSNLFTSVLQNPEVYPANLDTLQRMLSELRDTQLGRLQLAGFLMLEMERAAAPIEQWWPRLEPVLSGLEHARFPHFIGALEDNRAQMYRALGLADGAARAEAEHTVGHPHGPLLQYLAPRLGELARVRQPLHDGSDALCRRLLLRLLREWTLNDGPPGVRLLAADLLAHAIAAGDLGTSDPTTSVQIAAQLREWRAVYRDAATARPALPYPIGVGDSPDLQPDVSRRFMSILPRRMWTLGGLLGAGLVAAVSLAFARAAFIRAPQRGLNLMLLAGAGAMFVLGGVGWTKLGSASVAEDMRRLAPEVASLPRTPIVGLCLVALALVLTSLARSGPAEPRGARVGRVAVVTVWACMLLGICSLLLMRPVGLDQGGLLPGDRIALVAGADCVHLLDALQAWQP